MSKTKTVYLATDIKGDSEFNEKVFEEEQDCIDFCTENNWGWHEVPFYTDKTLNQ
jgi:hypothetical protein